MFISTQMNSSSGKVMEAFVLSRLVLAWLKDNVMSHNDISE